MEGPGRGDQRIDRGRGRGHERQRPDARDQGADLTADGAIPVDESPFRYDPAILDRFPNVVGGAFTADVVNGPTPAILAEALASEVAAARVRIGSTPLSEVPSLAA